MSARRPVPGAGWGGRPPRPPALPHDPPVSPPDEWGDERVAALLSEADQLMAAAQHDTKAAERLEAAGVGRLTQDGGGRLTQDGDGPSLSERLILLHAAEAARDTRSSNLNLSSNLLERLNQVDPLNRVVVQLWPGDEGYSIALAARDGSQTDLGLRLSYNDNHILDCIDNEEIPVIISDLLEGVAVDLFYSGCVVAEVRDHRREGGVVSSAGGPHSRLVLLRPSTQSIICDSQALAKSAGQGKWTSDERNSVESQVVLATQGPLCLDPSPVVSLLANKTNHAKLKFNTVPLRRAAARRYSQAGINRKRKLEAAAAPPELRLHDFIQNLNNGRVPGAAGAAAAKRKTTPVESLARHREASRAAFQQAEALIAGILPPPANATGCLNLVSPDLRLAVPAQVDVAKHVRPIGRRADTNDMTPQVVEEYVLETAERGQARVYHTRLTILQRQANDEYIGELYVERDYKEGDNKGSTCRFLLGTRPHALRYINQFTEIFTEEGRKSVKITHRVPNQAPRITFTPGMRASMTAAAAGSSGPQAAILQRKNSGAQTPTVTVAQTTSVQQVTAVLQTTTTMAPGHRGVSIQLQPQQVSQAKLPASLAAATVTSVVAPVQTPHTHLLPPHSTVTTTVPSSIASKLPTIPLNPANIQATSTMIPSGSVQVGGQSIQVGSQSIQLGGPNGQTIQVGGPNGQTIQVGGPNGQTIQVGGPNGQTIQVGGTNGQTIQVGNSNITVPGGIQVAMGPQQDTQQEAISAIVQSLMNAGAQFEHQKKMEEQRKVPPSVNVASASPVQVVSGAVLPTVPVPPANLVGQSGLVGQLQVSQSSLGQLQVSQSSLVQSGLVGQLQVSQSSLGQLQVSQSSLGQLQVTPSSLGQLQVTQSNLGQLQVTQSSLGQLQVTQSNLGQLQVSQSSLGQLQVSQPNLVTVSGQRLAPGRVTLQNLLSGSASSSAKVTMPQLAAQLSRPYTNVTVTASLPTYSQALAASHQTSPRPAARRPSEQPSPDLPLSSPTPHSTPGLHALLADTPAADKPVTGGCGGNLMVGSNSTLLERLVSGGSHPTSLSSGSTLSQVATQLPMSNHASSDTNEITLAALLANPPKSQHPPATSPTKSVQMSPLLQQLQQPIQSVNPGRLYSASLTSPRQTSTPSPQPNLTSPRPLQPAPSPRPLQPAQSPRASALQQQLMQPPSIRYQSPGQSILSAQLSAPITSRPTQSLLSQQLQQSSQPQLLQQGVVQVAQSNVLMSQSNQAVVTVTLQDLNTNNAATLNAITSMNAANGTVTVTGRPLSTSSIQPSFVNLSGVGQVQLVNQNSAGGVQLVNQSIPVQLSIPGHSQPITFSVNLPPDNQHNATNGSMSSSPLIMSSVNNQPNKTHAVTVSSVGKFVSNGPNAGTVVLQGPGGNIIHLPQQPNQAQFSNIKPAPMSSVVRTSMGVAGGGVVMRQPSPLLVQMPGSVSTPQPIQIVRSVPVNQPPMNCNALQSPQHHQLKNSLASPSPSGPPTPQTPGVPPSPPNNVGHPPNNVLPPDSPLVAVQLGNHAQDHLQPHFLLSNQKQTQLVPQPLAGQILGNQTMNNQPHLKMRQQRKQSLK